MRQHPRRPGSFRALSVLLLALTLLLTACGGTGGTGGAGSTGGDGAGKDRSARKADHADRIEPLSGPAPKPHLPARITSADGTRTTVSSTDRIVPLSGSLAEIVFSLGLGKQVVGRDITATFEQAADLPVVTRAHDVSAEGVLSLKPTVVLAETTTGPSEAIGQIRDAGIPLVVVELPQKLDDIGTRIDAVAEALGVTKSGDRLRERSEKRVTKARGGIPDGGGKDGSGKDSSGKDGDKPRVAFLYVRGSAAVYLLGGARSGASSLIEAAGGVDAGKESGLTKDFTPITSEALVKAAPDVVLVMTKGLESVGGVDGLVEIPGVAQTPAGMDRRVATVDDGVLLSYGPRTDEVLRSLIKQIHRSGK